MKRIISAFLFCVTVPGFASGDNTLVLRCQQRDGDILRSLAIRQPSPDTYAYEFEIDREGAGTTLVYFESGSLKRRPIDHSCLKSFFSDTGIEIATNPYCETTFYNPAARVEIAFEYSDCK